MSASGNTSLISPYYAPEDVGFLHSLPTQFTHFSDTGNSRMTSFGLPVAAFAQHFYGFVGKVNKVKSKTPVILNLLEDLDKLNAKVQILAEKGKDKYTSNYERAKALIATGHIPLVLEVAAAAAGFKRAARTINASDLDFYFTNVNTNVEQADEYLIKHDMMSLVSAYRKSIVDARYKLNSADQDSNLFCNSLLNDLDTIVIKFNRDKLPLNCEQFDLCDTFISKLHGLICQLDERLVGKTLIDRLIATLSPGSISGVGSTVGFQSHVSEALFVHLKVFLETKGFGADDEITVMGEKADMIQNLAPLMEYLCARTNPFARVGVLEEKMVSNAFHDEAITAYRDHESRMEYSGPSSWEYKYQQGARLKYTAAQLEQLLFGPEELEEEKVENKGFFAGISATLLSITSGSAVKPAEKSVSRELHDQRALPQPEAYLMLMPTEHYSAEEEKEKNKANSKSM